MNGAIAERQKTTLLDEESTRAVMVLDETLEECQTQLAECERTGKKMMKALVMARAMNTIRSMITDAVLADVMALMNTPLGFKTDRDPRRHPKNGLVYSKDEVRDIAIIAMIDGARFVGNEFNIIAGNYYRTKEQFERRVREWPGVSNVVVSLHVPVTGGGGALVGGVVTWKLNGRPCRVEFLETDQGDGRIPVKSNEGMGIDAILGKATRKALKRVWDVLNGYETDDFDPDEPSDTDTNTEATTVETVNEPIVDKIADLEQKFANCKNVTECNDLLSMARGRGLDEQQEKIVLEWHTTVVERIRSSRGSRANQSAPAA